ncbi:Hypothetical protein POVR1_LOCUS274 [uncultured virus]|nr:Hypothetical protein POVR1_LOCUS274 [uncultured virus]
MCRKVVDDKLSSNPQIVINAVRQTRDKDHACTVIDVYLNEGEVIFNPKSSSTADLQTLTPVSKGVLDFYTPQGVPDLEKHHGYPIAINMMVHEKVIYAYVILIDVTN